MDCYITTNDGGQMDGLVALNHISAVGQDLDGKSAVFPATRSLGILLNDSYRRVSEKFIKYREANGLKTIECEAIGRRGDLFKTLIAVEHILSMQSEQKGETVINMTSGIFFTTPVDYHKFCNKWIKALE